MAECRSTHRSNLCKPVLTYSQKHTGVKKNKKRIKQEHPPAYPRVTPRYPNHTLLVPTYILSNACIAGSLTGPISARACTRK